MLGCNDMDQSGEPESCLGWGDTKKEISVLRHENSRHWLRNQYTDHVQSERITCSGKSTLSKYMHAWSLIYYSCIYKYTYKNNMNL